MNPVEEEHDGDYDPEEEMTDLGLGKFTGSEWKRIVSGKLEAIKIILAKILKQAGKIGLEPSLEMSYLGIIYLTLRNKDFCKKLSLPEVKEIKDLEKEKKEKKQNKPHQNISSKDKIIRDNLCKKVEGEIKKILDGIEIPKKVNIHCGELLIIQAICWMCKLYSKFTENITIDELRIYYDSIASAYSCLEDIDLSKVSTIAVEDMNFWINKLTEKISYKPSKVIEHFPDISKNNNYSKIYAEQKIRLNEQQRELLKIMNNQGDNGDLIFLNSSPSSGKTFSSILISSFLAEKKKQLIFACSVKEVRNMVATLCDKVKIPFSIAFISRCKKCKERLDKFSIMTNDEKHAFIKSDFIENKKIYGDRRESAIYKELVKLEKKYDEMNNDKKNDAIIKEWERLELESKKIKVNYQKQYGSTSGKLKCNNTCYECSRKSNPKLGLEEIIICGISESIMILEEPKKEYGLFFDECSINNGDCNNNAKLISLSPKFTILSSATLGSKEYYANIVQHFTHKGYKIHEISETKVKIVYEIVNNKGEISAPHYGCKTSSGLNEILSNISTNNLLKKFYNPKVAKVLNDIVIKELKKNTDLTLDGYFKDAKLIFYNDIVIYCLAILKNISCMDDAIVEKMCVNPIPVYSPLDRKLLFTKDAHNYAGGCIYVSGKPLEDVKIPGKEFLKEFPDYDKLTNEYKKMDKKCSEDRERAAKIVEKDINGRVIKENIVNSCFESPSIDLPDKFRINTLKHYEEHHGKGERRKGFYKGYRLENMPKITIEQDLMNLLIAGVGISSTDPRLKGGCKKNVYDESSDSTANYSSYVWHLSSQGKLAFFFCGEEICFGIDHSYGSLILETDMYNSLCLTKLYQLFGRLARHGGLVGLVRIIDDSHTGSPNGNGLEILMKSDLNERLKTEGCGLDTAFATLVKSG